MPQLNFEQNFNFMANQRIRVSNGTLSFVPFMINDSISFLTMNILITNTSANMTFTGSFGLYSLNASTLSSICCPMLNGRLMTTIFPLSFARSMTDVNVVLALLYGN